MKSQEYSFKVRTIYALLEPIFVGIMYTNIFINLTWVESLSINPLIKTLGLYTLMVGLYYYFISRKITLIINSHGLQVKGGLFFASTKPVAWADNLKVLEIDPNLSSHHIRHIKQTPEIVQIIDTKSNKLYTSVNLNMFNGIDRKKFDTIIASLNIKNHNVSEQKHAVELLNKNIDLGKKAGYLAYSSIGFVLVIAVVLYFDTYKTIDFGLLHYVFIAFGVFVAFLSYKYLTSEEPMIETNWLVVALFSGVSSFSAMFITLFIATQFAQIETQTYTYKKVNTYNEAHWENTKTNHSFWCRVDDKFDKADKTVTVLKSLTTTRIHIDEACPKPK